MFCKSIWFVMFCAVVQTLFLNTNGKVYDSVQEKSRVPLFNPMDSEISEGKKQYEIITNQLPKYGECWKKAVSDLHEGCKHLTEDLQSRLALSFSNCFLLKLGLKTYPCSRDDSIAVCMRNVDNKAFTTFTEFFTHTQSICFYLQSQVWQEQTENTIYKLSDSSARISRQLEDSSYVQDEVLKLQQQSLRKQELLMKSGEMLNSELEKSRLNARAIFNEFKASTSEQRILVHELFERIAKFQSFVLGEFAGFYTLIFYVVSVSVCYLLTSTTRTSEARFWVFIILTLNFAIERVISMYSIDEESRKPVLLDATGPMYQRLWLCRKIACSLILLVLAWFAYRYKDYSFLNNKLLLEIQQQTAELKCYLFTMGKSSVAVTSCKHMHKKSSSDKTNVGVVDSCYDSADTDSSDDRTFHYYSSDENNDYSNSFSNYTIKTEVVNNSATDESNNEFQIETEKGLPIPKQGNRWLVSSPNRNHDTTKCSDTKMKISSSSTRRYNLRARTPTMQKK